jgi:hypothetical protein
VSTSPRHPRQSRAAAAAAAARFPALLLVALALAGCSTRPPTPEQLALENDVATIEPAYWMDQPAVAAVAAHDFDALWRACRAAVQGASFQIDRVDFRGGALTSFPQISAQAFEPWRQDVGSFAALAESTLSTVRRTARFDVRRLDDGRYEATPRVLVERYSVEERRITNVIQFREIYSIELGEGSRTRDRGVELPVEYWFATGRDTALEKRLADSVRRAVRRDG